MIVLIQVDDIPVKPFPLCWCTPYLHNSIFSKPLFFYNTYYISYCHIHKYISSPLVEEMVSHYLSLYILFTNIRPKRTCLMPCTWHAMNICWTDSNWIKYESVIRIHGITFIQGKLSYWVTDSSSSSSKWNEDKKVMYFF